MPHSKNLTALLAVALLASSCSGSEAPLPEATGRLRAAPISVLSAPDGGRQVSVVVAPATPTGPLELLHLTADGKSLPADQVRAHRASASLIVLVDDSADMGERGLSPAANGLLQAVAHAVAPHNDRIGAIAFNDKVNQSYSYASPQSVVKRRGLRLDPQGRRCLNLGLEAALEAASAAPLPSRSILVATSGDDAGGACSGPSSDELIGQAQDDGISISVAHLGPSDGADTAALQRMALETGGQFWVLGTTDSLDALAAQVASGLASHLYLSFRVPEADGTVPVEVRAGSDDTVLAASLDLSGADGILTAHNQDLAVPVAAAAVAAAAQGAPGGAAPASGASGIPNPQGSPPQGSPDQSAAAPSSPLGEGSVAPAVGVAAAAAPAAAGSSALTTSLAIAGGAVAVGLLLIRRRRARKERETHAALAAVKSNMESERRAAEAARSAESAKALEIARAEEAVLAAEMARAEESERVAQAAHAEKVLRAAEEARAQEEAEAAQIARAREEARAEQIARAEEDRATEVARRREEAEARSREELLAAAAAQEAAEAKAEAERAAAAARPAAAAAATSDVTPAAVSRNGSAAAAGTAVAAANRAARSRNVPEQVPFALVGSVYGRYRLEAPLGRGGLGEVYRARDLQFDRTVAVKVLFDDMFGAADAFDSLMREVSLVDRITHPNVVRVYDVIRFEGRVAIVMEYVHGQSLSAITREQGLIAAEDFDPVLAGVAEALDAAHAAGVVHGDVTPGNVLITEDGKVKLCDFGVGRLMGDDPSAPRAGTPRFVAPEVLEGSDAGPQSDVYSLGALTLHVVAGRNADLAMLAPPFRRALEGALEADPYMRCASAGALAVAFHHAVEEDLLRRRGPVRRLMDGLRLRTRREQEAPSIELPPTVTFPILASQRAKSAEYDDPDRTQPLPEPGDFTVPFAPDITQPMGPRE